MPAVQRSLMRFIGKTLAHSITRVFGVILAALAAQTEELADTCAGR